MHHAKSSFKSLVKPTIQRAPREQGSRVRGHRGFTIPGAIVGVLLVVFGAVFARLYVPVHAAPQVLATDQALTLPIVTTLDPTLDAGKVADSNSYTILSTMQVGLVSLNNSSLAPIPEAITRLPTIANGDISPDGLTYTFHIKPNLQFSNGDPSTPKPLPTAWNAL